MTDKENIELAFDAPPERPFNDNIIDTPTRKPLGKINMDSPFRQIMGDHSGQPTPTPKKGSSSRVIEALHGEIDELKDELFKVKNRNEELKKANDIIKKRRDALIEQISNVKHENETVNSLLARKQRRITDLEAQLNDSMSSTDDLNFRVNSLQSRCDKLQKSEMSSVAEFERTKIAYDTIVISQKQYRDHYTHEIEELRTKLKAFIEAKDAEITKNMGLINKSDATIFRSLKSVTIRGKDIESKYEKRDEMLLKTIDALKKTSISNNKDTDTLMKASKELFFEIAEKLKIDHTQLLQSYLAESENNTNPYEEITAEVAEENSEAKNEIPSAESVSEEKNAEEAVINNGSNDEIKSTLLTIKKRQDKKANDSRSSSNISMEYRMTSLGKELNSSIPITDRETKVGSPVKVQRVRSMRKFTRPTTSPQHKVSESRRSSRIFDTDHIDDASTSTSKSTSSSRRTSKVFERSHSRRTSMIVPVPELKAENSSPSTHDPHDQNSTEGQGKKKRRRRRRRRNNQYGEVYGDSDDDGDHSGEESS